MVRGAFKEVYTPIEGPGAVDRKADFGRRFLEQAIVADDDPAERYTLLLEAIRLTSEGADIGAAMRGLGRLQGTFDVDVLEIGNRALDALAVAGKAATSAIAKGDIEVGFVELIEAAQATGNFDLAARACIAAKALPNRTPNTFLDHWLEQPVPWPRKEADAGRAGADVRRTTTADPAANLAFGRYLCFYRADWKSGTPMLAHGSDAELKKLATLDVAGKDAATIAEAWWTAGELRAGTVKQSMRLRAAVWYRRAGPVLTGKARDQAVQRLEELRRATLQPGLIADLYNGENFALRRVERIDPNVNFDWGEGAPDPRVDSDHFSSSWQGFIQAPMPGDYTLEVGADDGVIIRVDGRDVISEWHGAGSPYRATIKLDAKPHQLEVLHDDWIRRASLKVDWIVPGAQAAVQVPSSVFSHDPVWPWGPTALITGFRPADATAYVPPAEGGDKSHAAPTGWFKRIAEPLPWYAAKRRCEQLGGHLAWVRSAEHDDFLDHVAGTGDAYLGASDEEMEGRWEWTNFQRIDPKIYQWLENEPNGRRDENFLARRGEHGWNDSDSRKEFMCEWDQ